MSDVVRIGGAAIELDDPCGLYQALYAAKLKRIAGEAPEEVQFRSPVSQQIVRLATISMRDLDAELDRLSRACSAKSGKRTRFAKTVGYC